jgi:hypothetical protein
MPTNDPVNLPQIPGGGSPDESYLAQDDDHLPVTRGEMRRFSSDIRKDLKWFALVTIVGGQVLSHAHVVLPPVAGFVGAVGVVVVGLIKLSVVR